MADKLCGDEVFLRKASSWTMGKPTEDKYFPEIFTIE